MKKKPKRQSPWHRSNGRKKSHRKRNRPGDALFGAENAVLYNPDESIRGLERAAASGEPGDLVRLGNALARAGQLRDHAIVPRLVAALRDRSVSLEERASLAPYVLDSRPYVHDVVDAIAGYDPATHKYAIDSEQRWKIGGRKNVAAALRKVLAKAGAKTKDVTISVPDYANASAVDFNVRTEKGAKTVRSVIAAGLHGASIYPSNREDRSEPQTDYFEPGGPRIAAEWVGPFAMALLEAAGFAGKEAAEAAAYGPAPQLQPGSVVRFRAKGVKGKKRWAVVHVTGENRDQVELQALGGSVKGSVYSRVPIADLVLDSDQSLTFEGPNARHFRNSFESGVERGQQFDKFQAARKSAYKAGEAHAAAREAAAAAPATFVFSGPGGQTYEEEVFPIGMSNWAPPPPPPPAPPTGSDLFPVAPPSWAPPPPPPAPPRRNPRAGGRRNPFFAPPAIQYVAWAMNPGPQDEEIGHMDPVHAMRLDEAARRGWRHGTMRATFGADERHGASGMIEVWREDPEFVAGWVRIPGAVFPSRAEAEWALGFFEEGRSLGWFEQWARRNSSDAWRAVEAYEAILKYIGARARTNPQPNPMQRGAYPWAQKREQYATYDDEQLRWAHADAVLAAETAQDWDWDPTAQGWYTDDAATIRDELERRGARPSGEHLAALRRRESQKREAGLAENRERQELASLRSGPGAARILGLDLDQRVPPSAQDWSGGEARVRGLELENPCMDPATALAFSNNPPRLRKSDTPAFRAMVAESKRLGWPKHYAADLWTHDREATARPDALKQFGWILRESGTHMVPPRYDDGTRWTAEQVHRRYVFPFGEDQYYYFWDGVALRPLTGHVALAEALGTISVAPVPVFDHSRGYWAKGADDTLYTLTDPRVGRVWVEPGYNLPKYGDSAQVRLATRGEAEEHWQRPLHAGWKFHEDDPNVQRNPFFAPPAIQYVAWANPPLNAATALAFANNPPQWTGESVAQQAKNKYGAQSPWGYFRFDKSKGKTVRLTIYSSDKRKGPGEEYVGTPEAVADYLNKILLLAEQLQAQRGLDVKLDEIAKVVRLEGGFAK